MEDGDIKGEIFGWCIMLIFLIFAIIHWIAYNFGMWISPRFQLLLVKEYQRLQ